jgi:hypothetical protein
VEINTITKNARTQKQNEEAVEKLSLQSLKKASDEYESVRKTAY